MYVRNFIEYGKKSIYDVKTKNLLVNMLASFLIKGLAMVVSLINMPAFMSFFKDQVVLGLWFTALSMLNWIFMFDFGIGNGLRNYLVEALENEDRDEAKNLIVSSYCSIGIIVIMLSILLCTVIPSVNWNSLLNVDHEILSQDVLVSVVKILFIGILIQFFLKVINSILYALQMAALPAFLTLLSNVLLLIATFLIDQNNPAENLMILSRVYVLTINVPLVAVSIWVFCRKLNWMRFSFKYFRSESARKVVELGVEFLVLQLASMGVFNTREFLIMKLTDPSYVVYYQIYNKLFSLVSTFFVLSMTPMWSAITKAYSQKDYNWIKKIYIKTKRVFVFFSTLNVLVIPIAPIAVKIWLGNNAIEIDWNIAILFSLYNILYMWISMHCNFENGLSRLSIQRIGYLIACVIYPILAVLFCSMWSDSWIYVMAANLIGIAPMCLMQYIDFKNLIAQCE